MECPVFPVSAATHQGFDELLDRAAGMLEQLPPILHYEEEAPEPETPETPFRVIFDGATYFVEGPGMERLLESVNFDDQESLNWFHRMLRKQGVIDALREAGAGEGSTVQIGDMEFDFIE